MAVKRLAFMGSSLDDLRNFPDEARRATGFELPTVREAVYVLHAFQKKTRKTSGHDSDLARRCYRHIGGTI